MSLAYTPGLKRKELDLVRKSRMLPMKGEILVAEGDTVAGDQTVARTMIPGDPQMINVCFHLDCDPDFMPRYMLKREGDTVAKGELIALRKSILSFITSALNREYRSEYDGTLEVITEASGQVIIREPPVPVEVNAYIPGLIRQVIPEEGVVVECPAAFIQGIFGIGGETNGELKRIVESTDELVTADHITNDCAGKILIGGSLIRLDALRKAVNLGVKAIVVGGIEDQDLRDFLGYEIGVAVTGQEDLGLTLIVTEGFGRMSMARESFELLTRHEGRTAYVNGATQIRAGVIRPEIIIPIENPDPDALARGAESDVSLEGMKPGIPVRVIEAPYFGMLGHVGELPVELHRLETESRARVLTVRLEDGRTVMVARANVEIIEE